MKGLTSFEPMNKNQSCKFRLLGLLIFTFCFVSMPLQASATEKKSTTTKPAKTKAKKQSGSPKSSYSSSGNGLAKEWEPTNELKSYKQNYFLPYSHTSQPNYLPTSPNPSNQVATPLALQDKEVKFQISL